MRISKNTLSNRKQILIQQPSKYTFGRIELEPREAAQQYKQAQTRVDFSDKSISLGYEYSQGDRRKRVSKRERNSMYESVDQRYLKYVVNREPKSQLSTLQIFSGPQN